MDDAPVDSPRDAPIAEVIYLTLSAIVPNTWRGVLPDDATFPGLVFSIHSATEEGWVSGADYRSYTVQIAILGHDTDENQAIRARIVASLGPLDAFIGMEDEHDGEFEDRPEVYVWMMFVTLRTRGANIRRSQSDFA
ncbi:MAG: hypothetical protein ACRYHA_07485 [Janthinobacterium lividum]